MRRGSSTHALALLAAMAVVVLCACQPVPTTPGTQRVVLFGDSLPAWLVRDGSAGIDTTAVTLINGTLAACEGADRNPPARSRTGALVPTPAECAQGWKGLYPPHVSVRPDVAIVMAGTHAMLDHQIDGTWRHPCHSPALSWYTSDLTARLTYLKGRAARVVIVLPAWPTPKSQWIMPADYAKRADCVRSATRSAASATKVTVVDLGAYLCPSGASSCNTWRSSDGMHLDKARAATVLAWLLGRATATTAA